MPEADSPSSSKVKAYVLAVIFLLAGIGFISSSYKNYVSLHMSVIRHPIGAAPWALVETINDFSGNLFNALFLWLRDGPDLLCLPSKLLAILTFLFGNFVMLIYVAYILIVTKGVAKTLVPCSEEGDEGPVFGSGANRNQSRTIQIVSLVLFVLFVASLIRAVVMLGWHPDERYNSGYLTRGVVLGDAFNLLLPLFYVFTRESGNFWVALAWVVGILVFDYGAVLLYVILLAQRSLKTDSSFRYVLLSKSARD